MMQNARMDNTLHAIISHSMQKKILVAEDDAAILEVINIILDNEGYSIFATDSEKQIHQTAREDPPDLILLDIRLAGHDGGKIAKDLKTKKETKHIPVIIMSANNETETIARNSGAEGFLLKPFTIDDLLAVVRQYTQSIL